MELLTFENVQNIAYPTILAFIALLFDLFINQKAEGMVLLYGFLALPRELMLLSLGFSILHIFNDPSIGVLILLICFGASIFVYALYQASKDYVDKSSGKKDNFIKQWWPLILMVLISFVVSIFCYFITININIGGIK